MTLHGRDEKPAQTRTQKIVMWCVFGVAAVLLVAAVIVLVVTRTPLF